MKSLKILGLFLFVANNLLGQDSLWTKKIINEILELNLPKNFDSSKASNVITYDGYVNDNYYVFRLFEIPVKAPPTKKLFEISLDGFYNGLLRNDTGKYTMVFGKGSLGGIAGEMAYLQPKDTSEQFKRLYFYVTLANQRFYLFQACSPRPGSNSEDVDFFFNSIIFSANKVEETNLK